MTRLSFIILIHGILMKKVESRLLKPEFIRKTLEIRKKMKEGNRIHFKSVEEFDAYLEKE